MAEPDDLIIHRPGCSWETTPYCDCGEDPERVMPSAEKGLHRPVPGPMYWDWRCLACGEAVSEHPSWWRRLLARVLPPEGGYTAEDF